MKHKVRPAISSDAQLIHDLVMELAEYEKLAHEVIGTVDDIKKTLFCDTPHAEMLILEEAGKPQGFVMFFYNYSTFLCRPGLYIEDLYVRKEVRGKGYGKALFQEIAKIAKDRKCGRVEWRCLDWNKTAIDFYKAMGAEEMTGWNIFRLNESEISALAKC